MAFTESLKLEVRKKAAFRCCRCQTIGVQIHHILPQANDGPDTIENAAPLCPSCHDYFGANPVKRKEITEMRDWWYQAAERKYGMNSTEESALDKITADLQALREDTGQSAQVLEELKNTLREMTVSTIDNISTDTAAETANELIELSISKAVSISDLKQSPIRHDALPRSLTTRINVIYWVFSDYLDVSKEDTFQNFQRDMHPEREVEVWEYMAKVILEIRKNYNWDIEDMKAALGLLLMLSSQPAGEIPKKNIRLSEEKAAVVFNLWAGESIST